MRNVILKKCSALAAMAIAALVMTPGSVAAAQSQNPVDAFKDAWKKAKDPQQLGKNGQPAQQQKPGQQQKPQAMPVLNGPFTPPPNVKIDPVVVGPALTTGMNTISPHGVHVATVTHSGSRQVVIYDGVGGPKFDQILGGIGANSVGVIFSPDGNRYAYCGQIENEWVVMVDGKEFYRSSESFNGAIGGSCQLLSFTSNSKHVYFSYGLTMKDRNGHPSEGYRFVWDGKPGPLGLGVNSLISPDGDRYVYTWQDPMSQNSTSHLVVDGKPTPDPQGGPQWTGDGRHLYTRRSFGSATSGTGIAVEILRDGKPIMRADGAILYMPPVGDMVVAIVQRTKYPGSSFLAIEGKEVPGSENPGTSSGISDVIISPDGKRYAALYLTLNGRQFIFSDGKKGLNYTGLTTVGQSGQPGHHVMAFSPDSSKLVYLPGIPDNRSQLIVINGQESDELMPVEETVFSPTGNHVATSGNGMVSLDGKILKVPNLAPNVARASDLTFSPDGTHLAFRVQGGGINGIYLDGQSTGYGPGASTMPFYVFSPDSKHFAFFCRPGDPARANDFGLCLDGKFINFPPGNSNFSKLSFTPDSKHLFWMGSIPPYGYRVYMDGNPVFDGRNNQNTIFFYMQHAWEMGADGAVSMITTDGDSYKRVRISVAP
jgi:hypothetical protein